MDPISAAGITLSVAGLAGQVFTGCIQCIQFILTARDLPKDCQYLNMRLRLEQQRLFAWSETSGLLDFDADNNTKVLESNAFGLHRSTILELLVQIKVLFEDFERHQKRHKALETLDGQRPLGQPPPYKESAENELAKDASEDLIPLIPKRKHFIDKAMSAWSRTAQEGQKRLRWAMFDKTSFEGLLQRFSTLNDNITGLLDMRLQNEIYSATQDTNRGVLQLHHDLIDLQQLVKATLVLNLKNQETKKLTSEPLRGMEKDSTDGLELLAQLARFKAFNESIETESHLDATAVEILQLGNPGAEKVAMEIDRSCVRVASRTGAEGQGNRCEGMYRHPDGTVQRIWIEWKDYDWETPGNPCPSPLIIERAQKLAALLHHCPKPEHFRVPHCLGYFDNADHSRSEQNEHSPDDDNEFRIGFIFEKPDDVAPETPPVSLLQLLQQERKPRVTDRVALGRAVANCILYLHSVNWLHKGLRSHNIVFFRTKDSNSSINYSRPYISGFDFARPARPGEQTEIPVDSLEYNLYRHPNTQNVGLGPRDTYRKSFDVYSLGVVLVELAHWQTIDQILRIDLGSTTRRPKVAAGVRSKLLDETQLSNIGAQMGEVYEQLVRKCITGVEDNLFFALVVKRLEEIRV